MTAYTQRSNPAERVAQLELDDIASFIQSELNSAQKALSHVGGCVENIILKRIFIARLKFVFNKINQAADPYAMLDEFRKKQSSGNLAGVSMMAASADGHAGFADASGVIDGLKKARPPGKPVLLYAPCGGFMLPPSPKQQATAARLAAASDCELVMAKHRFAPEHPYPAAPTDLADQYEALLEGGVRPSTVVMSGDTSGTAITLSALLILRERGTPMPAGVILFSPWADLSLSGWSYITQSVSSTSPYRMEIAAFCARLYLQDTLPTDPGASPAFADFTGFPPLAVHTSKFDIRFDDALKIIENAKAANVPCKINYWDSPRHHLERFNSKDARKSFELASDFIQKVSDFSA